ncbi:hypothetical protein HPB49_022768 [Dermacentor silvarum]|uniref:Uncharacterized protein n=1 Tax=Dermacentor silvarum TaxID=543639 RepID=A0ACB8E3Q5_DERSI|nr:hypothetical protein HPB49_022768 [Dermacentor silvarum]
MLDGDSPKGREDEPPSQDESVNHLDCVSSVGSVFSRKELLEAQREDSFCRKVFEGLQEPGGAAAAHVDTAGIATAHRELRYYNQAEKTVFRCVYERVGRGPSAMYSTQEAARKAKPPAASDVGRKAENSFRPEMGAAAQNSPNRTAKPCDRVASPTTRHPVSRPSVRLLPQEQSGPLLRSEVQAIIQGFVAGVESDAATQDPAPELPAAVPDVSGDELIEDLRSSGVPIPATVNFGNFANVDSATVSCAELTDEEIVNEVLAPVKKDSDSEENATCATGPTNGDLAQALAVLSSCFSEDVTLGQIQADLVLRKRNTVQQSIEQFFQPQVL